MPNILIEQNINFFVETGKRGKPIRAIHRGLAFLMYRTADKVCPFRSVETLRREMKNATLIVCTKGGHGLIFMKKKRN
ncbi:MAG: hypothetical protein IBJ00_07845 [Alphaproteobacteria bacterium]|nr:hypothetical protein [Alphaproteobacteria bacterium]